MKLNNMKYSLKDVFIVQSPISNIDSRSECDPYTYHGVSAMLPLFTAPMSSVVDLSNYHMFLNNKINPILPRTIPIDVRLKLCNEIWCAFSLNEFIDMTAKEERVVKNGRKYVLIDIANGNMNKLHDAIRVAKIKFGDNISIMAGNVANPEAYECLSCAGADYIRVGIGGGSACITSSNTGVHYPMASLISECYEISMRLDKPSLIIADGGIGGFGDIQKALALGADYVMCGSIFNKMLESAGETFDDSGLVFNQHSDLARVDFENGIAMYKRHYGMSTKRAQMEIGGKAIKTSEGIEKVNKVEYTIDKWCENFTDYLKSAMSYTNSRTLYNFIGGVETIIASNGSYSSINK